MRTWGKFSDFKRFSVPEWNKSQGDLTVFLKENSRGKRKDVGMTQRVLLQFLLFSFFILFYNAFPFLKQGKKSSRNTACQKDPNEAFQPYQSAHLLHLLFFFSFFFP